MDLAKVTAEDFRPLVDEAFALDLEGAGLLTLAEIQAKPQFDAASRAPFALLFRSADEAVLPQGIYRLEHSTTGTMEIFLVPVQQDSSQVLYEAVFN